MEEQLSEEEQLEAVMAEGKEEDLVEEDLEKEGDLVKEKDSQVQEHLESTEAEFEGVDEVEDIPKGKEKHYGI